MKTPTTPLSAAQAEALEARFALRLSARLDDSARALPHDISERLRVAREQAVRAAPRARPQVALAPQLAPARELTGLAGAAVVGSGSSGHATLSGWGSHTPARGRHHDRQLDDRPLAWGWRLASALPALALVLGLWGIQSWFSSEQTQATADVDVALLTDDLPPAAYADPGFEEFLKSEAPATTEMVTTPPAEPQTEPPIGTREMQP
ncbi:MAG: DUF3619 family protein [Burkholderiales bacterium]|nr:DUF3619 family protein [Burkholderiales bacterium]